MRKLTIVAQHGGNDVTRFRFGSSEGLQGVTATRRACRRGGRKTFKADE
jgi:hypothetical protein